jgi:F0F1-type ATP synthase assembly protein I
MSGRPTNRSPVSSLHAFLVLVFGILLGLTVGAFFYESIGEEPWGRVLSVAMGSCAAIGVIMGLMQDGMEPR